MFERFKKLICGVTGMGRQHAQKIDMYAPESRVPPGGLGVAEDGSCWEEWRTDPNTGEQWYKRISYLPKIQGIDSYKDRNIEPVEDDSPLDKLDASPNLDQLFCEKKLQLHDRDQTRFDSDDDD